MHTFYCFFCQREVAKTPIGLSQRNLVFLQIVYMLGHALVGTLISLVSG
ncbi:hypothetical protein MXB_2921 [Myxobolus squamalis]|nr:hypothetical protein MXB_2921 [Myxobolus squamalis]